jgi:predicted nuclease of predicted toxin-antitoxin system
MKDRILFDECLSSKLVEYFQPIIKCTHVYDIGLEGASDQEVYEWALNNRYVIASKNGKDFVKLMPNGRPGLIWVVDGHLSLKQQRRAIYAAIRYCEGGRRPIFIRVELVGGRYECGPIE